jgi:glycosyl transferase family 25|tara:strand:- start:1346 stop:1966 length:621 start_codon:yes stop_codon:yes gene_type:complete
MNVNNLEHIFYINLKERVDRKESVELELDKVGWEYTRFGAVKTKSGRVGCSMSHLKLLKMAKDKKMPYIVIVEDDIQFKDVELFKKLFDNFMNSKIEYDVFLLSGNLRPPAIKITESIVRVYKSFTTTGYIVKSHYYDKMIKNIQESINKLLLNENDGYNAIDTYLMKLQRIDKWYISYPRTVTQRPDYSDIENKQVNYDKVMLDI